MHVRRLLLVLTLAATAGLSAACGSDKAVDAKSSSAASAGAGTSGAAGTSAGASAGAPASGGASGGTSGGGGATGGKASTAEVCKNIVAALDKEKLELASVLVELATADNDAAKTKAKEHAGQVVARMTTAVNAETAKASDPKLKAAFDELLASLAKIVTIEGVNDPDFEAKIDKAMEGAATYCPALKE